MITIYHNGTCSKCRGALEILQEENIPHEVRWYMAEPLSTDELKALLQKLKIPASGLVRTGEPYYLDHLANKDLPEEAWLRVLTEHPELIQRPIAVKGDQAIVARPPERIRELL